MSRNSRILFIALIAGLSAILLIEWKPSYKDINPDLFTVPYLLLICIVYYIIPLKAGELTLLQASLIPGVYSFYHFHSGLETLHALELVFRCLLILILYAVIYKVIESFLKRGIVGAAIQLVWALTLPFAAVFFLIDQNIIFLLLLPIIVILLLYLKTRMKNA